MTKNDALLLFTGVLVVSLQLWDISSKPQVIRVADTETRYLPDPNDKDCAIRIKAGVSAGTLSEFVITGHQYALCVDSGVTGVTIRNSSFSGDNWFYQESK